MFRTGNGGSFNAHLQERRATITFDLDQSCERPENNSALGEHFSLCQGFLVRQQFGSEAAAGLVVLIEKPALAIGEPDLIAAAFRKRLHA
jgi:hypothetical protein